jgi:hypothetical protein
MGNDQSPSKAQFIVDLPAHFQFVVDATVYVRWPHTAEYLDASNVATILLQFVMVYGPMCKLTQILQNPTGRVRPAPTESMQYY